MRAAIPVFACLLAGCAPTKEYLNPPTMFAGATPDDVVKVTTYVVNWDPATHRAVNREERARFFTGPNPPASTTVGVQGLAIDGLLVEIEVIAVVMP
jgi:enamine deaminase RidA (YjgF/YER057c/UK114 family)